MNKQHQSYGIWARLFRLLPAARQMALVKWHVESHLSAPVLTFPCDFSAAKKVLVILPEDPLGAIFQINNLMTIATIFKSTEIVALCQVQVHPLFKALPCVKRIMEYDCDDRLLFTPVFKALVHSLCVEQFDMCIMLEHRPVLPLLYCAVKTGAPIRCGYSGAEGSPFLNLHIRPADSHRHISEYNAVMAKILGASTLVSHRWTISKEALDEVAHLLKESSLPGQNQLIGVDVLYFADRFGPKWVEQLLAELKTRTGCALYLYAELEPKKTTVTWLRGLGEIVFFDLPVSRLAALVHWSRAVVSGKALMYGLAAMLKKPVIGVFEEQEFDLYCRPDGAIKGIAYSIKADTTTIEKIADAIHSLVL